MISLETGNMYARANQIKLCKIRQELECSEAVGSACGRPRLGSLKTHEGAGDLSLAHRTDANATPHITGGPAELSVLITTCWFQRLSNPQ